ALGSRREGRMKTVPAAPAVPAAPGVPAAAPAPAPAATPLTPAEVERLRADFPILSRTVRGKPLVYLDNAATAQKPRAVIDAERRFYEETNANIHRGVHALSEEATRRYEASRDRVRRFLNAPDSRELIFVRGTTEAVNLV